MERPENPQYACNKLRPAAFAKSRVALRGRHENALFADTGVYMYFSEPTSHSGREGDLSRRKEATHPYFCAQFLGETNG